MRLLVYTGIFGNYDRVFPPVRPVTRAHFVAVTDDPSLNVPGWATQVVEAGRFGTSREANRYYKMLGHRELGDFDASIYVDGNVRLLGDPVDAAAGFIKSGAALGIFRHPLRDSVAGEVEACIRNGKVEDPRPIRNEYQEYIADGFRDDLGLVEATILMKNHHHAGLDEAMALWHTLYARHLTRDQISLPYVLWKTGLPCHYHPGSFRDPNPHFGLYPHFGDPNTPTAYAYLRARSFDSRVHRLALGAWHLKWDAQRRLRRLFGAGQ